MPPKHLHVLSITLGNVTGWWRLTVPRASIFGDSNPEFLALLYDEITGDPIGQATKIARLTREIQSLDYKIGPAVIIDDNDFGDQWDAEDLIAIRTGAILDYLHVQGMMGDSVLERASPFTDDSLTDKKLKRLGVLTKDEHLNAAVRVALTTLRRAREDEDYAEKLWPYEAWIDD